MWSAPKTQMWSGLSSPMMLRFWKMASADPANHRGPAAHLGRDRRHVVAEQRRHAPGPADVKVEAVALVLGEDHDPQEAGVGQVRQDEVDEPVLAAERHRGLGPIEGQRHQPLAFAAGEDDGQHLGHCRYRSSRLSPEYAVGQGAHPRPTVSLAGTRMLQPGDRVLRLERGGAPGQDSRVAAG